MANINSQFRSGGILRPWDIDIRTGRPRPGVLIQELGIEVQAGSQSVAIGKHIIVADKTVAIGEQLQPGAGFGPGQSVVIGFNNTHGGGNTVQLGSGNNVTGGNNVALGTGHTISNTNNTVLGTSCVSTHASCILIGTLVGSTKPGEVAIGGIGTDSFRLGFSLPVRADNAAASDLTPGSFYRTAAGMVGQRFTP